MSFETQVAELSPADLDKMFEASPNSTPTAEILTVGKEQPILTIESSFNDIPVLDESLLEQDETEKKTTKEKKDEESTKDSKETDTLDTAPQINDILKNTVNYLVEQGLWTDFDGRTDLDITQETYAELAAKQAQHSAYEIVNELIDGTGDYGKAIISHIKAGGNPDEIIDLFKEQKILSQIDTSTEQGKQTKIEKYYQDILGWKPEKVKKHVTRLIEDNEIDSEFEDVQELYDKHYHNKLNEKQEEIKEVERKNNERQAIFVNNIKSAIADDNSLSNTDRHFLENSILNFRHKLSNGQKVNDFYLRFAEIQADPKQYVDLVRYAMDKERYLNQLQLKEKTKASAEIFNFIKGNSAMSKVKSNNIEIENTPSRTSAKRGTDFSFAIKK